ncbi:MAG: sulfite exporter TauE/SafE family protein [Ruminococcaceae bacterium]|nr:sulfite exporter TauE/SafE family protein [Oscillospiraceae bacterium]
MKLFFSRILPLLLLGLGAGLLNGLLGAGGGILLVYGLQRIRGIRITDRRAVFATALAVTLPLSCLSAIHYFRQGSLAVDMLAWLIFPAILGGALGGLLLRRLSPRLLSRIFAAVVLVSGVVLLL